MIVKKKSSFQLKAIILLSVVMLTSFLTIDSAILSNFTADKEDKNNEDMMNDDFDDIKFLESPKLSIFGNAPWWDSSYEYRMLINVTNPYFHNIKNFGVNVTFNYASLVSAGKMQSDLDDIRIVEMIGGIGVLRNYYVVKDYPTTNYVTVFFDTNVTADKTETDTYLYFGNPTISNSESDQPSETFGWIKNGDFELDIDLTDKFEPFGWYFSHNPVEYIMADPNPTPNPYNSSVTSYQYFVNKLEDNLNGGHRVASGTYSYKFGAEDHTLPDSLVNDYAGTLFSYPFKVPIVEGSDISLIVYRNIRTHRFERPKNMGTINKDGYFIRVLNGSDTLYDTNPDNHDDNDIIQTGYDNYLEAYDGYCYYNNPAKKWDVETQLIDYPGHTEPGGVVDTYSDELGGGIDGDLTGYLNFDISTYEGKEIFFELGVWGDESNTLKKEKSAFFQVDDLRFNYSLSTSINEIQARKSDVTVDTRDVDGNIVPNVHIIIIDESSSTIVASGFTSTFNGSISFYQLLNGEYNFTANYTLGIEERVVGHQMVELNGTSYTITLNLNLWTIDFEVVDWDGIRLNLGSIEIYEDLAGILLDTLTLDQNGKATFCWLNKTYYYFKIYYENEDYTGERFLLNESYVSRNLYEKDGEKFRDHTIWVNNTNTLSPGANSYSVSELFYANGSRTEIGNRRIIKVNISLTNMVNQLTDISIYYIDKDNSIGIGNENLIYFEDDYTPGEDSDFIELDIPSIENAKLESESYEVYGLLLEINGINFTLCNGIIEVSTIETCNIFNRTNLARLNIRIIKDESGVKVPYPALIKVLDNKTQQPIVNLTSRLDRNGYAYTTKTDLPFWFLKDKTYNISLNSLNVTNIEFNVTYISPYQWHPTDSDGVTWYNYTLYGDSSIEFNLIFKMFIPNITNYVTSFFNASGTTEVQWGQDMRFSVSFYLTDDNGQTWNPITNPSASCMIYIREAGDDLIQYTQSLTNVGGGNFTIIVNSNIFSAGSDAKYYTVRIKGLYPGYPEPNPQNFIVKIKAIPTIISAHEYDSYVSIPSKTYSAYFDELINITIKYSIEESGTSLTNAILTYEWIGLYPITIYSDPQNSDYFTFTINTANAQSTGLKIISITASLENYKTKSDFLVYLNIFERRATLNNETVDLLYVSSTINVEDLEYFDFTYRDYSTNNIIGDLNIATFIWEELYENGTKVAGSFGSGTLIQNLNNTYTLDFKTDLKQVGYYFLYVSLKKENYVQKNAFINLVIQLRRFIPTIETSPYQIGSNNQIQINQGTDINFEVRLWDETRDVELQNASVSLNFRDLTYSFNETIPGTYKMTLETHYIDTFISAKSFVGKIYITAANFTSQEFIIYITVKMEEIFPGMPTFYFILITASIIGVLGSVVAYRVIQQARIPKHVKKVRKIKNLIKSKKKITEIPSIPTKEQMIVKMFGNEWKEIGLSLDEVLGIQDLKSKKPPKKERILKDTTAIDRIIEEKVKKEKIKKKKIKKERGLEEKAAEEEVPEEKVYEEELPKEKVYEEEVTEEKVYEEELPEEKIYEEEVTEEKVYEEELPEEEIHEEEVTEEKVYEEELPEEKIYEEEVT
ncbi:MAG: hypothetical protein ACFE9Q_08835, partial [Candidatus Hodarchaeota archaeon]